MKMAWAVIVSSAAVCVAAIMVLFGQFTLWTKLTKDELAQKARLLTFDAEFNEQLFIKNAMQNRLAEMHEYIKEMEGESEKATLEQTLKAADLHFCEEDKTKKKEQLSDAEKEKFDAEAVMLKEKAAWNEQSASLHQVKEKASQICDFIKKDSLGVKLCAVSEAAV